MVANKGKEVVVKSPAGSDDAIFYWHDDEYMNDTDFDENMEIVDSIKWIVSDIHELLTDSEMVKLFRMVDSNNYESVKHIVEVYNNKIEKVREHWKSKNMTPGFMLRRASRTHLKHIIQQCYNRAVGDAEKLNQYMPFSPEVYGETSYELIYQMIQSVRITADDSFIDLGSGVGQVVLQVAASTRVKSCIGIEKADYPAQCANALEKEFRFWMAFYGKPYQPFSLIKDDFLEDNNRDQITSATVIFANNFAFGPNVDHQLKLRYANLKEGARVISSKSFCPLNFRISDRNLSDIGSIMSVRSLNPLKGAVSWTDKPFSYFVHTIDRSSLEDYFAKLKNPPGKHLTNNLNRRNRKRKCNVIEKDGVPLKPRQSSSNPKGDREGSSSDYESVDEELESSVERGTDDSCSNSNCDILSLKQQLIMSTKTGRIARPNAPSVSSIRHPLPTGGRVATTMNNKWNRLKRNGTNDADCITGRQGGRQGRGMAAKNRRNKLLQEHEGLQMLHTSTVSSVESSSREKMSDHDSTLYNSPAMLHFANKYQPRELHGVKEANRSAVDDTDHRLFQQNDVVPFALRQYLELIKQSFMTHFARMRSTDYRSKLEQDLAVQKAKNEQLKTCIHKIEESIATQHKEGKTLLNAFLNKVGINVDTPLQFFGEARKLIKNNHLLELKIENIKKQITNLQSENDNLNGEFSKLSQKLPQQQQNCHAAVKSVMGHVSAEEQHRLLAEHVHKLKSLEELQQFVHSKNGSLTLSTNPAVQQKLLNGNVMSAVAAAPQVGDNVLSNTTTSSPPKKERKKYQPRGQGSPNKANKVKQYPGPGRPKKVADETGRFSTSTTSTSTMIPVKSHCSMTNPQAMHSSNNLVHSVGNPLSSNTVSKQFIHTSLEELIKQEIMRPATPPASQGNTAFTQVTFAASVPSPSINKASFAGAVVESGASSRQSNVVNNSVQPAQSFTLIPVTLCQPSSSLPNATISTSSNSFRLLQSSSAASPQTPHITIMKSSSQILTNSHPSTNHPNNSKPPILQPMNSIPDQHDSLHPAATITCNFTRASTPNNNSSSPAASLNSNNTPRSVETLSAYSPVSRPPSIESGRTPPCTVSQRSPAGSLCNLPLSNLPPRKRAHYESFAHSSMEFGDNGMESCSSPKIAILNDSTSARQFTNDSVVKTTSDSVFAQSQPRSQYSQIPKLSNFSFGAPPVLSQSYQLISQNYDSADHVIPGSPPTLKAVEFTDDTATDQVPSLSYSKQ